MAPPKIADDALRQVIELVERYGGDIRGAAIEAGENYHTFKSRYRTARIRLGTGTPLPGHVVKKVNVNTDEAGEERARWTMTGEAGIDPEKVVRLADPKTIRKVATYTGAGGRVTGQWLSESPAEVARVAAWQQFADELRADLPRVEPMQAPTVADTDLMVAYPVADHHFGMLAWAPEAGADYDLSIADGILAAAAGYLMDAAPPAAECLLPFMGDMLHYDGYEPKTPQSGHALDADSRFPLMVQVATRGIRRQIEMARRRHKHVRVVFVPGNHDPASTVFLRSAFAAIYEDEPRVTVDTTPGVFHYVTFGANLIGLYHGHQVKFDSLPKIMARDRPREWGATTSRYWWTGHIHHSKRADMIPGAMDLEGCSVEAFRSLIPPDSWHAFSGYRAPRDAKAIVLHRQYGEQQRITFPAAMFDQERAA